MKFETIKDLEALASLLETKSHSAAAKAEEHAKLKEIRESERMATRAKNGLHYAQVCREAARILKIKVKRQGFTPPTWEELLDYVKEKLPAWPMRDVEAWFNHFTAVGWRVGGGTGKPMVDWRAAARNGYRNSQPKTVQTQLPMSTSADPAGWRDFLKQRNRPYKPFLCEQEFLRDDFYKGRKK